MNAAYVILGAQRSSDRLVKLLARQEPLELGFAELSAISLQRFERPVQLHSIDQDLRDRETVTLPSLLDCNFERMGCQNSANFSRLRLA